VLDAELLQAVCDGSEELLQEGALRFIEVRASVWHSLNRVKGISHEPR
jgi:hypothetical protein